jgi:hypothetical protein
VADEAGGKLIINLNTFSFYRIKLLIDLNKCINSVTI